MNCPQCGRSLPPEAQFCIYCRARVVPQPINEEARPATGPTVRLGGAATSPPVRPQQSVPPMQPQFMAPGHGRRYGRRNGGTGAGIFPFGMLILFLTGWWWPGILVLLGITALINGFGRGRQRSGMQGLIFFLMLALLFSGHHLSTGLWFFSPFLLILCMMLPMSIWWWFDHH